MKCESDRIHQCWWWRHGERYFIGNEVGDGQRALFHANYLSLPPTNGVRSTKKKKKKKNEKNAARRTAHDGP